VYTVVSQGVSALIDQGSENGLIVLMILSTLLAYITVKINKFVHDNRFPDSVHAAPHSAPIAFIRFFTSSVLNLVLQFQSTFIARLGIASLKPQGNTLVIFLALYGIILLWLLQRTII